MLKNQKEIANHVNCYFFKIAGNALKSSKHKENRSYQEHLKNLLPNSHIFLDCDPSEVECLITSSELSKSSDPFSIPVNILHMLKRDIANALK